MKKIVISALVITAACAVLTACGPNGSGSVNENTDPQTLKSEKLSAEKWTSAFKDENNYTVKTVIGRSQSEGGTTRSEEMTLIYRCDGEKSKLDICVKRGGETTLEAEAYVKRGDVLSTWQRRKEDGNWSEWEGDTDDGSDLGAIFGQYGDIAFVREDYESFTYNDEENGYTATTDGLEKMQSSLRSYVCGILSQSPDGECSYSVDSFVVKFNGGKPSACLFELAPSAESEEVRLSPTAVRPLRIPFRIPFRNERLLRRFAPQPHVIAPRLTFETPLRPVQRKTDSTAQTATGVHLTQIFYDYGTTQVHLPANLPTLDEE